ncbi:unnamed protein product [Brassicogethes aeneus]|uniref:phosphoinositide phospholipase C n=1 Tax=Brassicogethes aeneus TaxID=1431903 RepID=A0A9P0BFR2_BRAAE|nr:unnamed protein product [Brassicogethes aeneus]
MGESDLRDKHITLRSWQTHLRTITHNNKSSNVCPRTALMKHWMRLNFSVDPVGKIPVKVIAKTFASGRTEKLVYQFLSELGLPSQKNDSIEPSDFTFDKFYALYHKICPRNDIEELFRSITQGKAEYMNINQMIEFLNEKQRDPRLNEILYPLYDEKRAAEIIDTYEQDEESRKERRLTKDGFTSINTDKTKFCLFGRKSKLNLNALNNVSIVINNINIMPVNQIKYLGVIFDNELNFHAHADYILRKFSKKVNFISRIDFFASVASSATSPQNKHNILKSNTSFPFLRGTVDGVEGPVSSRRRLAAAILLAISGSKR